jgi:hypothetical protein
MSGDRSRNIAASVHARLKNVARKEKRDFNLLLIRYALERFLARLSYSAHRDEFVLKGALLFVAWEGAVERPTRDLDLLRFGDPDITGLEQIFGEICQVNVEPDGLIFDATTVKGSVIREGAIHDGVRMKFMAFLGNARTQVQVDVGFGDAVDPPPELLEFPVLLDQDRPSVWAYLPETVIAEKFHAMVTLGMTNSRLRDYYDIWRIIETMTFEMPRIASALLATFEKRGTRLPTDRPEGLTKEYSERWDDAWRRLSDRFEMQDDLAPLTQVIEEITEFLVPALEAIDRGKSLDKRWTAGRGWR